MTVPAVHSAPGSEPQPAAAALSVPRAILSATLTIGVLDATDGIVFRGLHGQSPIKVLQFIASSVEGPQAFAGGLASAGLGLALHFAVSLVVAAVYILASRRVVILRTFWLPLGLLYGIAVWCVMNLLFLPHTAIVHGTVTAAALANGVIGHALFVGLPSAFFAKKTQGA